jgi:anti-sigma regulatory factor (Ser/Thr protein kinase)
LLHDHVVHFYKRDDELADTVSGYLIDALRTGGVAVIIATPSHEAAFEAQMAAAGVNTASARARGALVHIDARETLSRFLVDGRPDPERFDEAVGGEIRAALARAQPVHAYGEMVDLLWQAGQVGAAMDLEMLWSELGRKIPFSLFCSYHCESICGAEQLETLDRVCSLHSAVIGRRETGRSVEASRSFSADLRSPRRARRFATEAMQPWADDDLIADAAAVITELATNAIVHAASAFTVTVQALTDGVRLSLLDSNPHRPLPREPAQMSTSGRGLRMVASLARDWGSDIRPDGKLVWAELASGTPTKRLLAQLDSRAP